MAVNLNLDLLNEGLDDIADKRTLSMTFILSEQRKYFNVMIEKLNLINQELVGLKYVKEKSDENERKLNNLITIVVPALKDQCKRDTDLANAKIMERIEEIEKERLLENSHRRRLHLIINGVKMDTYPRGESEPTENIFRELLVNKLKLNQQYVGSMLLRDVHRLPKSAKSPNLPPPIIAAFVCQKHRNDVMSNAKELKGSDISIKSDLPMQLNTLRGKMLKIMKKLRKAGKKGRVVERTYLPVLQTFNVTTEKWDNIMDFDKRKPLQQALNPTLPAHISVIVNSVPDD